MPIRKKKYFLKGFTIIEVLISLMLTSITVTLSYSSLNYVQKLFYNYKTQNKFISEYTDFKKRMDYESLKAKLIIENSENNFTIKRDSANITFQILDKTLLLFKGEHCDTFHIEAKKIKKEYELMKKPLWTNKLLKSLRFETEFSKQKFNFQFDKNYDSSVKMELEQME